jgi:hypothetical protein
MKSLCRSTLVFVMRLRICQRLNNSLKCTLRYMHDGLIHEECVGITFADSVNAESLKKRKSLSGHQGVRRPYIGQSYDGERSRIWRTDANTEAVRIGHALLCPLVKFTHC